MTIKRSAGGPLKRSKIHLGGPKSETLVSGSILPADIVKQIQAGTEPEFPDNWVVAGSREAATTAVWLNGVNMSDRCIAFEKLYTARTAYWGTICCLVKIGPIIAFDPTKPPAPFPLVYMFRKGIIVWEDTTELLQGPKG